MDKFVTTRHWKIHGLIVFLLLMFLCCFQAYVVPLFHTSWAQLDLVSIAIVYLLMTREIFQSFLFIFFTSYMLQSVSLAPQGFFLMYYMISFLFCRFVLKYIVLNTLFAKFNLFVFVFALKFMIMFLLVSGVKNMVPFYSAVSLFLPGFLSTLFISVPAFAIMSHYDEWLKVSLYNRVKDF